MTDESLARLRRQSDRLSYLETSRRLFAFPELSVGAINGAQWCALFDTTNEQARQVYQVGSLSKIVTACVILSLIEEKRLGLDDQVARYLCWFGRKQSANLSKPKYHGATIADLLLHVGGLPRGAVWQENPTCEQVAEWMQRHSQKVESFASEDREASNQHPVKYSNLGYILLGLVIEEICESPFDEVVQERIFEPVGMTQSGYDLRKVAQTITKAHQLDFPSSPEHSLFRTSPMAWKNGPYASMGMYTSLTDFCRFLSSLLNESKSWLSKESVSTLLASRREIQPGLFAGFGFNLVKASKGEILFENAEHFGHSAAMLLQPQKGTAVVAMTNRGSAGLDLSGVIGNLNRHLSDSPRGIRLDHHFRRSELVLGRFTDEEGSALSIISDGSRLLASIDREAHAWLWYKGQDSFVKSEGRCKRYLFRLDWNRSKDQPIKGVIVGPSYFSRAEEENQLVGKLGREPRRYSWCTGIYRNEKVGRIALFERRKRLFVAFSAFKEAELEQREFGGGGVFVQRGGPYCGEEISIDQASSKLTVGSLVFQRTTNEY